MGALKEPLAWQALSEALQNEDPAIRRRARVSLAQATGEDFGNDVLAWHQFVQSRMGPVLGPTTPYGQQGEQAVAGRADQPPPR